MKIRLNQKIIKDMCGNVSFKRGDSFYRADRVTFQKYQLNDCEATVTGAEDFHVKVEVDSHGDFQSSCSCPSLPSFKNECQHIAAVLLAIYDYQKKGAVPFIPSKRPNPNQELTEGLLTLFTNQPKRSSGHQLHFENRQVIDAAFTCKTITIQEREILGVEMSIDSIPVQDIRNFLEHIKHGGPITLSDSFTYDPSVHCFQRETDAVIHQLVQVTNDEKVQGGALNKQMLQITPTSWERVLPFLVKAPLVSLQVDEFTYNGLRLSKNTLPLKFDLSDQGGEGCQLTVQGLDQITVMKSYGLVLANGEMYQLPYEEIDRLVEMKQMLANSMSGAIPIPKEQFDFFLDKVVPGLKKLGNVQISPSISNQLFQTPLVAKLYLDRVSNRLLAGLEFHYENIVINPLESQPHQARFIPSRDVGKERAILKLMEESSFATTDSGYVLHNEELEYEFLYHVVPKLQQLVQVYATTAVRNRLFKENAHPKIRIKMKKERTNWLEFKFEMEGMAEKEIRAVLAALEEKRKYYRLKNGSLLSLETREFEEIDRFLNTLPVQSEDWENELNIPVVRGLQLLGDDSKVFMFEESFRQFLETIQHPSKMDFEVPKQVEPILHEYQKQGYQWMKTLTHFGFGGILADDMGLGKTLQSISFLLSELSTIREKKLPALVVCPSSLTYNWLSELMKFAPEVQAVVIDGTKTERVKLQKDLIGLDVVITSYPLLLKDLTWYQKQSFHTVFFDEAQAFKNPVSQTAKAVKRIQADYRFALTGTPVENSLEELWSIFHVVFPELFLGFKEYSNLTRKQISRRIRPFLLRRMKEEVLSDIPEKLELMETVELLPDQKNLYAAYLAKLKEDTLKHLDKDTIGKNRIKILAGLTRLRQICCHPALFVDGYRGSSSKFEQLMKIVDEAKFSGRRVLIFSQFTKMLNIIGRELANQGVPFFYLDGQTPSEERLERCNRFNDGERDIFLISLKAGGTGLNLTGADTVILYDLWWNPAVEEQAADRAHRMGQTNEVQVIKLIARGTIEEKINELQEKKRHLVSEIIDSKRDSKASLSEEDIREILMI
ncbi:DEAD/DEAH box helicase [Robertmurraya korlensis]|uniref:DEAD/DEAH box helicase n=1 Tax=Robertmurraya korlensis TaxID=519977 RepID=UPI000824C10E|nr:DEAD/DEAH box helicase [Robertmurraya korlensis]